MATSTRVMSRKRGRSSKITAIAPEDSDVSTSQAAQNTTQLCLPTELIYTILAISMGEYIGDMMLYPSKILKWDAILTFLHVSRTFRGCTVKLLYHLWGDTFIRERTSVIGNYKPTHAIFRQLAREACSAPQSFAYQNVPPRHHSARVARHPISPLARIWSAVIRNTATANAALQEAEAEWFRADFGDVYTEKDLQTIRESYAEIPAGVRSLLQGRIMHSVLAQAAFWRKLNELRIAVFTALRLLVYVEPVDEIQIRTELPELTESAVAQMSRERHASLADEFSLTVEDIPPVRPIHTTAAGFHMVVPMLNLVEKKGPEFEGICHVLRSYIACYLTENETALFLK